MFSHMGKLLPDIDLFLFFKKIEKTYINRTSATISVYTNTVNSNPKFIGITFEKNNFIK